MRHLCYWQPVSLLVNNPRRARCLQCRRVLRHLRALVRFLAPALALRRARLLCRARHHLLVPLPAPRRVRLARAAQEALRVHRAPVAPDRRLFLALQHRNRAATVLALVAVVKHKVLRAVLTVLRQQMAPRQAVPGKMPARAALGLRRVVARRLRAQGRLVRTVGWAAQQARVITA